MNATDQARYEQVIFRHFANAAALDAVPESIRSHEPPHPDLSCRTTHGDEVAFELVQVVDEGVAQAQSDQRYLQDRLRERCDALPTSRRDHLNEVVGNAHVAVWFAGNTSRKIRAAAVPKIIEALEELDQCAAGDVALPDVFPFVRLKIGRGTYRGPWFQVLTACCFGDPLVEMIRKKFSKPYETPLPLELLAFYDRQSMAPDRLWLPDLKDFVGANFNASPFRRIWLYDARRGQIRFVWPRI